MTSATIFVVSCFFIQIISGLDVGTNKKTNILEKFIDNVRSKPEPLPTTFDITEKTYDDYFPQVEYPTNILDVNKPYALDSMGSASATNPNFDRSVSPDKFAERMKKKQILSNNEASKTTTTLNNIDTKFSKPSKTSNPFNVFKSNGINLASTPTASTSPASNTLRDSSKNLINHPNFVNNRKLARKLAAISKEPKYSLALHNQGNQMKNSSKWSKDVPVIQVVEDAIVIVENILKNSSLVGSDNTDPTIPVEEAKKLVNVVNNIAEILNILSSLHGIEDSLYYNIKTGVVAKLPNSTETDSTSSSISSTPTITTEENIQIVDEAKSIVGDILNASVLQNIEENSDKSSELSTVILTQKEADEMVNVISTVQDILKILTQLDKRATAATGALVSNT